jgi:hypothetical protein
MKNKILLYLTVILLILFSNNKVIGNIIYDKNDIFITEIEFNKFKKIYIEQKELELTDEAIIKNIVLIKKTIQNLTKRNPDIIKQIDKVIINEMGEIEFQDETVRDFFRFLKIRNEFMYEYYQNDFDISDLKKVFKKFETISMPISQNKCLTIDKMINVKNNEQFLNSFFKNFKTNNDDYKIIHNGKTYNICINENDFKIIESEIIKYIELITESDFNEFIYVK